MFPKFLKIASDFALIDAFPFNETHYYHEVKLFRKDITILNALTHALGFSYEVMIPPVRDFGRPLPNGSWTGALGMLQRREVDMVVGNLIIDEEIHEEFRTTHLLFVLETTFITRKPRPEPAVTYFLHPFSIQVWLAIIACIFLMPFLFHHLLRRKHSIASLFRSILGSLVGQGFRIPPQRRRDYFVQATWILSSALLYYFYAAVLLSCLTFPPLYGIRTIPDLAKGVKDGTYECSTYPERFPIPRYLIQSKNPTVRAIVNDLNYHERADIVHYFETYADDKKPAFIGVRRDIDLYKDIYFISDENFFTFIITYATNKDFCCVLELDQVILRLWESGTLQKVSRDLSSRHFTKNAKKYGKVWGNSPAEGSLNMTQFKGVFTFLVASHSLAFLIFLFEVCTKKIKMLKCFKNRNLKKKLLPSVCAVKGKISSRHRSRMTKRKQWRFKNSVSIATPIAGSTDP